MSAESEPYVEHFDLTQEASIALSKNVASTIFQAFISRFADHTTLLRNVCGQSHSSASFRSRYHVCVINECHKYQMLKTGF